MKLFTCKETFFPVGGASVVIASSEEQARALLIAALLKEGLPSDKPFTLVEIPLQPAAIVLNNGDY